MVKPIIATTLSGLFLTSEPWDKAHVHWYEQAAEKLNIKITGLVGVLLMAKERGLIKSVVDVIEEVRNNGYWLSNSLVDIAKQLSGE